MSRSAVAVVVIIAGLMLATLPAFGADDPVLVAQGHAVFETHGCPECHRVNGVGGKIGPDLTGVGHRYSAAYLTHWLRDNPYRGAIHMPKIEVTHPELQALEAYLISLRGFPP